MATAYSTELTNYEAIPQVMVDSASAGGKVRVWADTIAAATTDIDDNDIIMMAEIPSNAKIKSILLYNDDLDSGGSPALVTDVGIYNGNIKFTSSAGTIYAAEGVIDRDCYGTVSTVLQAAVTAGTEFRYETLGIETVGNFMWEDGGLPEDPGKMLRIALTIETVAATAASGDITMVVEYIVN
jgi:hypothetical protein|tara:strand:- start:1444 stop:1992 length:549 start_codon:yes stop_codon:yes gene_type:complete